jgi:aminoglycoside phosphotransferase
MQIGLGCTAAAVYRFDNGLYLKTIERDRRDPVFGSLASEHVKLVALKSRVPVPEIVAFEQDGARDFLLMTEVFGSEASTPATRDVIQARVRGLAEACRRFHQAPTDGFPLVELAHELREIAAHRVALDLVDSTDFDPERRGKTSRDLLRELYSVSSGDDDIALTHGDMCLPNIILLENQLSGFRRRRQSRVVRPLARYRTLSPQYPVQLG